MPQNLSDLCVVAKEKTAVVFVTDPQFLLPTYVAFDQLSSRLAQLPDVAVFIIMVDFTDEQASLAVPMLTKRGANVEVLRNIPSVAIEAFHRNHVPMTTLARLFICEVVPKSFQNIVYLDGDISLNGNICDLLKHRVKDGFILAANDKYWLGEFGRKKTQKHYLDSLGTTADAYFNCGVLAFRRSTWEVESQRAFQFFIENPEVCTAHDQSALNYIFRERRELLSPLYNFITDYTLIGAEHIEPPRVVHFSGGLKPWFYSGPPWGHFAWLYASMLEQVPELGRFSVQLPEGVTREMEYHHRKRQALYKATVLLPLLRRERYRRYLRETTFDVG